MDEEICRKFGEMAREMRRGRSNEEKESIYRELEKKMKDPKAEMLAGEGRWKSLCFWRCRHPNLEVEYSRGQFPGDGRLVLRRRVWCTKCGKRVSVRLFEPPTEEERELLPESMLKIIESEDREIDKWI